MSWGRWMEPKKGRGTASDSEICVEAGKGCQAPTELHVKRRYLSGCSFRTAGICSLVFSAPRSLFFLLPQGAHRGRRGNCGSLVDVPTCDHPLDLQCKTTHIPLQVYLVILMASSFF